MHIPTNLYIENALKNGLDPDAERFFRKKFDNADWEHVSSVTGHLDRQKMVEVKSRVDEIVNDYNELTKETIMTKEQRDLSKVMFIYNYILENVMYTQCQFVPNSSNVFGGNPYKHSIYGALVLHDAVCSGISEAFDCLCKVMDVESTKLLSTPQDVWGGGHAFNSVKIGDTWYKVDAALEIGLRPGHKIKDGKWKDRNFLVPFSEPHMRACVPAVFNCTSIYPREKIEQMKRRLADRGLNFLYDCSQIIHDDLDSALNSFLIKKIGNVDFETIQNFESSIAESFEIKKINGIYVAQRRGYVEEDNMLYTLDDQNGFELYLNDESKFIIKSIHGNRVSGFTILRRNGELVYRLPLDKWNPTRSANTGHSRRR